MILKETKDRIAKQISDNEGMILFSIAFLGGILAVIITYIVNILRQLSLKDKY